MLNKLPSVSPRIQGMIGFILLGLVMGYTSPHATAVGTAVGAFGFWGLVTVIANIEKHS